MTQHPVLSRRDLLRGAGALSLAAAIAPLATACGGGTADVSTANARLKLPTYVPFAGVKPDLAAGDNLLPGFYGYPADPVSAITGKPGEGAGKVDILVNTFSPVPPARGQQRLLAGAERPGRRRVGVQHRPGRRLRHQADHDAGRRRPARPGDAADLDPEPARGAEGQVRRPDAVPVGRRGQGVPVPGQHPGILLAADDRERRDLRPAHTAGQHREHHVRSRRSDRGAVTQPGPAEPPGVRGAVRRA